MGILRRDPVGLTRSGPSSASLLSSQTELRDDFVVVIDIFSLEIIEKFPSTRDHLQQSATGVIILLMCSEVLGELVDALSKKRNLNV